MKIYLVGGAVRDELLGRPVIERDWVVVGASPGEMLDRGFKPVGKDFPVFLHPDTGEEYALARTERKSGHGYHGFDIYAAPDVSLEDDLERRDLTVNAIARDTDSGELIDPYGGLRDLENKTLRHVSDAFAEDPVRVLRVARFAARYAHLGFVVSDETLELMRAIADSGELDFLVPERVWRECEKALGEKNPEVFFSVQRYCGALFHTLPELHQALANDADAARAFARLRMAVAEGNGAEVRLTALCLDLDKNCEKPLLEMFLERIKVPNQYRELLRLSSRHVQTCHDLLTAPASAVLNTMESARAFRNIILFERYLAVCEADHGSESDYPQAEYFRHLRHACANVSVADIQARGFKAKAIGDELRRQRLALIDDSEWRACQLLR